MSASRTGSTFGEELNQTALQLPHRSTKAQSTSTRIEYQAHTAVVSEFERQFLFSKSIALSLASLSFPNARSTVLPAIVSWKKEMIGEN